MSEKTIAIFCAGQAGDCLTISSVLKYKDELWGDCKIVWYISEDNVDLLKYKDIDVRIFPRGFGHPKMVIDENKKLLDIGKAPIWEDWLPLVDKNNHMNLELKKNYPSLADIDYGYFPAPHQVPVPKRHGISYPDVSKRVFSIPDNYEWHPLLNFSAEEVMMVAEYMSPFIGHKNILVETFAGSGQSRLDVSMVENIIQICKSKWTNCNLFFGSHKFLRSQEQFPQNFFDQENVYSCAHFTVRQFGLLNDFIDLIVSVSSGITVACSAWDRKPTTIIQYTGSFICSTKSLAYGRPFELVTADGKKFEDSKGEFELRLISLLNKYR